MFGFEEALGFSVDDVVRDKDGISAALRFAEVAAVGRADGRTVGDRLEQLARRYGEHATRTWSMRADGADGLARIASTMTRLRADPPESIGSTSVVRITDLAVDPGGYPPTDALVIHPRLAQAGRRVMLPTQRP